MPKPSHLPYRCPACRQELTLTIWPEQPPKLTGDPDSWAPGAELDWEPEECPCGEAIRGEELEKQA